MTESSKSVIIWRDQGMYCVYECTLENARQLVHAVLSSPRYLFSDLKAFDEASRRGLVYRRTSHFSEAMKAILLEEASSIDLARLLYKDERRKEAVVITPQMKDVLMAEIIREAGVDRSCLDFCNSNDFEAFGRLWKRLDFLQVAREQFGEDVHFQHDELFSDLDLLQSIERNKWKESSPVTRIVGSYHCRFLNRYAVGQWDVETIESTVSPDLFL